MYLISKTLILYTLSLVASQEIEHSTTSREGIIVGPKTPIFLLTYPRPNYLKVKRMENIFPASPAYNSYLDLSNRNGVLFIDVLIVLDHFLYQSLIQDDIVEILFDKWHKMNEYFKQINSPEIKLKIAGVVVSEVPDTWNIDGKKIFARDGITIKEEYFYVIPSTLDSIRNWFTNNKDSFEDLSYDLFIYVSNVPLLRDIETTDYWSSFTYSYDLCQQNDTHEPVANGGLVYADDLFSYTAVETIAIALGIPPDDISKCGSGYIMDPELGDNILETWSECSKEAFKKMNNNPKFDCLKHTTYIEDKMNYDD